MTNLLNRDNSMLHKVIATVQKDVFFEEHKIVVSPNTEWLLQENGGSLTDPRNHSSNRFSYLVHALTDKNSRLMQDLFLVQEKSFQKGQYIDLLTHPEKIAEKKIISCSLIDQSKFSTFSNVGLILNCPPENIVGMSSSDAGTDFSNPDQVMSSRQTVHKTPQELLQETSKRTYNEVVITGSSNKRNVSIIGCFIKTAKGRPNDPETSCQIQKLADRLSVPVVEIDETEYYADSIIQVLYTSSIAFNRGGERYLFDTERKFLTIYECVGMSRLVSRRDVLKSLYILNKELAGNPSLKAVNTANSWNWRDPFTHQVSNINSEAILTGVRLLQKYGISIDHIHDVYEHPSGRLCFEFEEGTNPTDIAQIQERINQYSTSSVTDSVSGIPEIVLNMPISCLNEFFSKRDLLYNLSIGIY